MFPVIDFRNGRYQGQTRNQLPNGVGFFIDKNFLLCLAEWIAGEIAGHAIIIFPSGRVFAGEIAYRQQQGLCLYELAEDHVQLLVQTRREASDREKMTAVLPLLRAILEIDNTRREEARVLSEYNYSPKDEENRSIIAKALGLSQDRTTMKQLSSYSNFIQFFRDKFLSTYPELLEFIVNEHRGKKEYFMGLRGQGLGVKVQPAQELGSINKQSGRVYAMRAMGSFTKQNQLRDLGLKTLDNPMKGCIMQEGVFSAPHSLIKYEPGKRPINCAVNFHNYIKRSLYYRDKVLETSYIYELETFVQGFNRNLRIVQTERLAQFTIQNPNNHGDNLAEIQRKRREREREREREKEDILKQNIPPPQPINPYHPTEPKLLPAEFSLNTVKDQIYRSAGKKKALPNKIKNEYQRVEYTDPNYDRLTREDLPKRELKPSFLQNYKVDLSLIEDYPRKENLSPHNRAASKSPLSRPKSKSPYQYLYNAEDQQPSIDLPQYHRPSRVAYQPKKPYFDSKRPIIPNRYRSEREVPHIYSDEVSRTPFRTAHTHRYPQSQEPIYKSFLEDETNISRYRQDNARPRYDYHFDNDAHRPISPFRR